MLYRVYSQYKVQLCIVHQIRSSIKRVGSKHQKEFLWDLKTVYGAVSKETAETQLDALAGKWGEMYPIVIKSWRDNWNALQNTSSIHLRYVSDIHHQHG